MTLSIRAKLALAMWVLVAALVLATTLVADRNMVVSLEEERSRQVREEATRIADLISGRKQHLASKAELLGEHPDVTAILDGTLGNASLKRLCLIMEVDLLALVSPDGRMVVAALEGKEVEELPTDIAFRRALEGAVYQDVVPRNKTFELRATWPVKRDGEVIGAIMAGYLLDERFLDEFHQETGIHAAYTFEAKVWNSTLPAFDRVDSRAIFRVKEQSEVGTDPLEAGEFVWWPVTFDETPYDAVFCPLFHLGSGGAHLGTLVLLISAEPLMNARSRARQGFLVTGFSGMLLSTILAWIFATGLTRPVRQLAEAAHAMHAGDLSRRTGIRRSDELGELGKAFDDMADALERHVDEVQQLAVTDELTGLANHRRFKEEIQREVRRAGRFSSDLCLIFMDIDHFKKVNDTYGHAEGDEVLRSIGRILTDGVRAVDLPCRYGGEEFAVILPSTDKEQAVAVAERLRRAVAVEAMGSKRTLQITISGGVASYPEDGQNADTLLQSADARLYRAKESGRNKVVSDDE